MTTTTECGCAEGQLLNMSRRGMLKTLGGAALFTAVMGDAELAFGAPGTGTDHTLVTVMMAGGMDGLSVVAPVGDPAYAASRPNIAVPARLAKRVDPMFGLHPSLAPLFPLWESGKLAAVHAVGQESPTRSHFQAMNELERAAPGSSVRTGWLNRTLGMLPGDEVLQGVSLSGNMPGSFRGPNSTVAVGGLSEVRMPLISDEAPFSTWRKAMSELHAGARPEVTTPMSRALDAVEAVNALPKREGSNATPRARANGGAFSDIARLIKARSGLRMAHVTIGGWDNHVNIGSAVGGSLAGRIGGVASTLAKFAADLGPDLSRVTVITLSEFGRRVAENGQGGLDHGHGNCMLVMGGSINGGKVYGTWPGLAAGKLDHGDLAGTTDYRTVIAEILTKKMGVGSVNSVFPGLATRPLGIIRSS